MTQIAQRAYAQSKANRQQHHVGATIKACLFGRMAEGTIIAIHPFGVVDVDFGNGCFGKISGVNLAEVAA